MAGPGPGEIRLTIEAGSSRFVTRSAPGRRDVTAGGLAAVLPSLVSDLTGQLERAQDREQQAKERRPPAVTEGQQIPSQRKERS